MCFVKLQVWRGICGDEVGAVATHVRRRRLDEKGGTAEAKCVRGRAGTSVGEGCCVQFVEIGWNGVFQRLS